MLNYQAAYVINGQPATHTAAQGYEGEIPFVEIESVSSERTRSPSLTSAPASEIDQEAAPCCPLAEAGHRLQQILLTLPIYRKTPLQRERLLRAMYELLEEIDQTYAQLEQSLRAKMAGLQLEMIKESSQRQQLVSNLEGLIESTNIAELKELNDPFRQLIADSSSSADFSPAKEALVHHPQIAEAARRLAMHQQPASLSFRQLQQQIYHAANHLVRERQEVSETLGRSGLPVRSRQMKRQATMVQMGSYRPTS